MAAKAAGALSAGSVSVSLYRSDAQLRDSAAVTESLDRVVDVVLIECIPSDAIGRGHSLLQINLVYS